MFYFLFALFFACNDYGINKVTARDPELVVYPSEIHFGFIRGLRLLMGFTTIG